MSNSGYSLHIGLNHVDPASYHGWAGVLAGCLNDAHAMQAICTAQGFDTRLLLDEQATADAVLGAIDQLARSALPGDTVVISYSGHGGQIPDTTNTEDDGLSETWVCFDRMVVDKELYARWSGFRKGVYIEVYSDSCHSGTIIKEVITAPPSTRGSPPPLRGNSAYRAVYAPLFLAHAGSADRDIQFQRLIPTALAYQLFKEQSKLREQPKPGPIECGVALVSGCQDNQTSADGDHNGLFTEKLLAVWNDGAFEGTVPQLRDAILAMMPADQTPGYVFVGILSDTMANGRALSVLESAPVPAVIPTIVGPASLSSDDPPPQFVLTVGAARWGAVEVTNDPALFAHADGRMSNNFYGTWSDSAMLQDGPYTLPASVWNALGSGPALSLYYRVISSSSRSAWEQDQASTTDADAAAAPFIAIRAPERARALPTAPASAKVEAASVSRCLPSKPMLPGRAMGQYQAG